MPIGIGLAIAGIAGAGASLFGASAQVGASKEAIKAQEEMYALGIATQKGYVQQAQQTLAPFIAAGEQPLSWYNYLTGAGPTPTGALAPGGALGTLGDPNAPGGSAPTAPTLGANPLTGGTGGGAGGVTAQTVMGPGGQPITVGGGTSFNPLNAPLTAPFTAANLPYTPGYQFNLGVGLQSTQNAAAAQGLGISGNALKGAADYATGLAGSTYNQQFANYLTQNQQIANMLLSGGQIGATAGETMAGIYGGAGNQALGGAVTTGQGIASSTAGIGNALAGGAAGVANSLGGSLLQYQLYNRLLNPVQSGNTIPSSYTTNALASSGAFGPSPAGYGAVPFMSNPFFAPNMTGTYPGG